MLCVGGYRTKPYMSLLAPIFQWDFERTMFAVGLVYSPVEIGHNDIQVVILQNTLLKVQKHPSCHYAKRCVKWSVICYFAGAVGE